MDRDLLIDTLARVLAGLQVPLSLDGRLLGTAAAPYREILNDSSFGWRSDVEFADYLRRTLTPADDRAAVTGEQTP